MFPANLKKECSNGLPSVRNLRRDYINESIYCEVVLSAAIYLSSEGFAGPAMGCEARKGACELCSVRLFRFLVRQGREGNTAPCFCYVFMVMYAKFSWVRLFLYGDNYVRWPS